MNNKIKVGIVFGGKSAEHEVSLRSAKNIVNSIDRDKYDVELILIDKQGRWLLSAEPELLVGDERDLSQFNDVAHYEVVLSLQGDRRLIPLDVANSSRTIDVVFPILHGTFGEDGTIQGLFKMANVPFIGASVLGSAIGMDKDVMKRLLRGANIPIPNFCLAKSPNEFTFDEIVDELGSPFFVKPANAGSSVGVSRVQSQDDFDSAIQEAFKYDRKILIEEAIFGREIECAVLGNDNPIASVPGEVVVEGGFYSYDAKYTSDSEAVIKVPAELSDDLVVAIQDTAIRAYQALECEGMGRVDVFVKDSGEIIVNEINTIPGFTSVSLYPKLWEASGLTQSKLIDRLIGFALERYEVEQKILTSFTD